MIIRFRKAGFPERHAERYPVTRRGYSDSTVGLLSPRQRPGLSSAILTMPLSVDRMIVAASATMILPSRGLADEAQCCHGRGW